MGHERVSVVVPHHGDPAGTTALVEQLRRQTGNVELEIVVVDDASPEPFPATDGITLVRRETNGGFAAAVNSGLAVAHAPTLLVLNSDVSVEPDFVATLLAGAEPVWPAVVTTRVVESFGERCMGHTWPTAASVAVEHLLPLARFHGHTWFEHRMNNLVESIGIDHPLTVDWVTGICLLMPTEDVRAVGGFDERYFMNCEEVDLQKRLCDERGLRAVVLPAPVIRHVGGGSSPSQKRAGWVLDARLRYYEKWHGGPGLRNALALAACVNLVWNGARSLCGRDVDARGGFDVEMTRLRHAWRTRR